MTAPIIAIEGLDGAGKNTLAGRLSAELAGGGITVGRCAFPRYDTPTGGLIADALHGRVTGLVDSPKAMAALFALDRQAATGELEALRAEHDVVLLDRWVASGAAYTAARIGLESFDETVDWVSDLEFERLGLPRPDLQLLLATSPEVAADRAGRREAADPTRTRDAYEKDGDLQERTAEAYRRLAEREWVSPWRSITSETPVVELAGELATLSGRGPGAR